MPGGGEGFYRIGQSVAVTSMNGRAPPHASPTEEPELTFGDELFRGGFDMFHGVFALLQIFEHEAILLDLLAKLVWMRRNRLRFLYLHRKRERGEGKGKFMNELGKKESMVQKTRRNCEP